MTAAEKAPLAVEEWQLRQRYAMPLKHKILWAESRIRAWLDHWHGQCYVAFSGGKDSTVLLDLVRKIDPAIPAVFHDTGLEFPEIRDFVKRFDNVVWTKPKMGFREVIKKHGYPVVSKRICQYTREARSAGAGSATYRLRTTGVNSAGRLSLASKISAKWLPLLDAPFCVSDKCCDVMKKRPALRYEKETGRKAFVGILATEGSGRELTYKRYGCNSFNTNHKRSWPIAVWNETDIWAYIRQESLPYSKIYDMGYTRTGCVFCAFGAHLRRPNQFQLLKETHPRLWRYCMVTLGMREVLRYCGIPSGDEELFCV